MTAVNRTGRATMESRAVTAKWGCDDDECGMSSCVPMTSEIRQNLDMALQNGDGN